MIYTFSEVLEIHNGKNQRNVENKNGNYPIYGSGGIIGFADKYLCDETAVIIGRKGSINNPIFVDKPFWNVDTAFALVPNSSLLDVRYLYYFCLSYNFNVLSTTVTIPSLTKFNLLKVKIEVPSLEEQKQIVHKLDKIEMIIGLKERQLKDLEGFIRSRFLEMFGEPWVNDKEFPCYSVGQVAESVTYGTSAPASDSGQYEYLRMNNLTDNGQLDLSDLKRIDMSDEQAEKYMVKKGDILFNRTNSIDLVGKTALFNLNNPMIIAGYLIRIRLSDKVNPVYFVAYMNMPYMKKILRNIAKGAVNQANINSKELKSIQILIPPLSLQNEYCNFVLSIDKSKYREAIFLYLLEDIRICCNI